MNYDCIHCWLFTRHVYIQIRCTAIYQLVANNAEMHILCFVAFKRFPEPPLLRITLLTNEVLHKTLPFFYVTK